MTSSSSSSSAKRIYDVFLSLSPDTHAGFTSNLHHELARQNISVFIDRDLQIRENFGSSILKVIEACKISLIVFSESYASSPYCLDQLVKILECRNVGQLVCPIFYDVDPSDVRHQYEIFGFSFKMLEAYAYPKNKLDKWRNALTEVCAISGWSWSWSWSWSWNFPRYKFVLIGEIVKVVKNHMDAIKSQSEKILSLLGTLSDDKPHLFGLSGMPGIGRTTLAEYVWGGTSDQFYSHRSLHNVREESKMQGMENLRNAIFSELLDYQKLNINTLKTMRVFIVLDDVIDADQLSNLIGDEGWLGPGSIVIVTSIDEKVLERCEQTYKVTGLQDTELAKMAKNDTKGFPLATDFNLPYDPDKFNSPGKQEKSPEATVSQSQEDFSEILGKGYIFLIEDDKGKPQWYIADTKTNRWHEFCKIPSDIPINGSAVINGSFIYYCGGCYVSLNFYSSRVYVFDCINPQKNWIQGPCMNANRLSPATISMEGKIYVFGGHNYRNYPIAEVFDPNSESWEPLISAIPLRPDLVYENNFTLLGVYDREILLHICDRILSYNVHTDRWSLRLKDKDFKISSFLLSAVHMDNIYFFGRGEHHVRYSLAGDDKWKANTYNNLSEFFPFKNINVPLILNSIDLDAYYELVNFICNSLSINPPDFLPQKKGPLTHLFCLDRPSDSRIQDLIRDYFSDKFSNLDELLLQNMDDQCWVSIDFLANHIFQRPRDPSFIEVISNALKNSYFAEVQDDKVRPHNWWEWVEKKKPRISMREF